MEVARALDITRTSVHDWLHDPKKHPSNEHTDRLLKIAKKRKSNRTKEILLEELKNFEKLIHINFD